MCIACSALFRYILKEVRVCFSYSIYTKKICYNLDFQTRIHPFSDQSLEDRVWEFEIFTTDIRMLRVKQQDKDLLKITISMILITLKQRTAKTNTGVS